VTLDADPGSDPMTVLGDAARLQQMLVNLLMNAAKYTPAGGHVRLTLERDADDIFVRVKDTGVGLRPEMLEKVFDLFVQAHETLDRAEGGMGVGLTLVRTIAELHGGSVRAFSEGAGKGSEFTVRLPRAKGMAGQGRSDLAGPAVPAPHASRPAPLVVIIEDNADSRRMLEAMLKLDGYRVRTAADGKEGLQAILELRPRFAIIDIGLPGLNGYQVARHVRKNLSKEEVILIALTGYGRPEDRRAVLEAGFDEHLVKPLNPKELVRVLGIEDGKPKPEAGQTASRQNGG
jgi:CheY-like chemotaxis protein